MQRPAGRAVWVNPAGQVKLREGRITPIYQQPLSGHHFLLSFDTATAAAFTLAVG